MICLALILSFAVGKAIMLAQKHNPLMSQTLIPSFYDQNHVFNFRENGFQVAIGVVDYTTREPKDDPEYVRWLPQLVEVIDGVKTTKRLNFHKCTDTDFALFHKPNERAAK